MTDNRYIVAVDKNGKRMEWTQQGINGTVPQAIEYLDQLKSQLPEKYVKGISDDPHQGRMDIAVAAMWLIQDEGWDSPDAPDVISTVGSALHLLLGTKTRDVVVIDLTKRSVTLERKAAA